jgi:hypothetical protein
MGNTIQPQDCNDEVSTRFKDAQRVWMMRNDDGMYSLIASG